MKVRKQYNNLVGVVILGALASLLVSIDAFWWAFFVWLLMVAVGVYAVRVHFGKCIVEESDE